MLATALFCFTISFLSFGLLYVLVTAPKGKEKPADLASLYRHGVLDLEKVIDLIEKEFNGTTTVGIITETVQPKKPITDPEKLEIERNIYVRKSIDPTFFLCTTFFNLLPEYFTLQNELMFIEDMGIEATSKAYDKKSINTLLNEINESKTVEDKEFYTNLLLDIKARQK